MTVHKSLHVHELHGTPFRGYCANEVITTQIAVSENNIDCNHYGSLALHCVWGIHKSRNLCMQELTFPWGKEAWLTLVEAFLEDSDLWELCNSKVNSAGGKDKWRFSKKSLRFSWFLKKRQQESIISSIQSFHSRGRPGPPLPYPHIRGQGKGGVKALSFSAVLYN